jgi:hypothetical protein
MVKKLNQNSTETLKRFSLSMNFRCAKTHLGIEKKNTLRAKTRGKKLILKT